MCTKSIPSNQGVKDDALHYSHWSGSENYLSSPWVEAWLLKWAIAQPDSVGAAYHSPPLGFQEKRSPSNSSLRPPSSDNLPRWFSSSLVQIQRSWSINEVFLQQIVVISMDCFSLFLKNPGLSQY